MMNLAPSQEKCNPQKTCSCCVHAAIGQARVHLHDMGFDPHSARGLFAAELSVLLARLDAGLPAPRGTLESLFTIVGDGRGMAA